MNVEISIRDIGQKIYVIRGHRVMLDSDLAELYEVPTKRLNERVQRNRTRFPDDFMFRLTEQEFENLRSQIATSSFGHGGRRFLPLVFTEHGVSMLASVLNSDRAIQVNIMIVRAFVQLRELLGTNQDLAKKFVQHDEQFQVVFEAIRQLMSKGLPTHKKIKGLAGYIGPGTE